MCRKLINLGDKNTRLEMTAKPYAIFKDEGKWGFAKFQENKESNLEVVGEAINFDSLQQAFNHAEKNQLMFF